MTSDRAISHALLVQARTSKGSGADYTAGLDEGGTRIIWSYRSGYARPGRRSAIPSRYPFRGDADIESANLE